MLAYPIGAQMLLSLLAGLRQLPIGNLYYIGLFRSLSSSSKSSAKQPHGGYMAKPYLAV